MARCGAWLDVPSSWVVLSLFFGAMEGSSDEFGSMSKVREKSSIVEDSRDDKENKEMGRFWEME